MADKDIEEVADEAEAEQVPVEEEAAAEDDGTVYHPAGTGHVLQDGQWVRPETEEEGVE